MLWMDTSLCQLSLTKKIKMFLQKDRQTDRQSAFREGVWLAQGHTAQTNLENKLPVSLPFPYPSTSHLLPPFPCPSMPPPSVPGGFQGHLSSWQQTSLTRRN